MNPDFFEKIEEARQNAEGLGGRPGEFDPFGVLAMLSKLEELPCPEVSLKPVARLAFHALHAEDLLHQNADPCGESLVGNSLGLYEEGAERYSMYGDELQMLCEQCKSDQDLMRFIDEFDNELTNLEHLLQL